MSEPTKVLFVRNIPERLIQKAKSAAALEGWTLTRWIIRAVENALKARVK